MLIYCQLDTADDTVMQMERNPIIFIQENVFENSAVKM